MRGANTVELDKKIGNRVKELRLARQVTQQELSQELDITFQQVQKYESGADRISSSTLFKISEVLRTPVTYFFKGMGNQMSSEPPLKLTPQIVQIIKDYETLSTKQKKSLRDFLEILKNM